MPGFLPMTVVFVGILIFNIILIRSNKGKSKTDQGVQLIYYKLSYRRRMIRDVIVAPFIILFCFGMFYNLPFYQVETFVVFALFFILITAITFTYNFIMWKKHEKPASRVTDDHY